MPKAGAVPKGGAAEDGLVKITKSKWFWIAVMAVALGLTAVVFPDTRTDFLTWAGAKLDASAANTFTAILTACVTLVGIYLTNKANTDRAALQFKHERITADRARTFDLKRAALLDAAETIQARLALLPHAARPEADAMEIAGNSEKQAASLARAYAVGSDEAFVAIYRAQSQIALAAGAVLTGARLRALAEDALLKANQQTIDAIRAERATHLAWLHQPGVQRDRGDQIVAMSLERVQLLTRDETTLMDAQQAAMKVKFEAQMEAILAAMEASEECEGAVTDAILAIRSDLGIHSDPASLRPLIASTTVENLTKTRALFVDMKTVVERAGANVDEEPPPPALAPSRHLDPGSPTRPVRAAPDPAARLEPANRASSPPAAEARAASNPPA